MRGSRDPIGAHAGTQAAPRPRIPHQYLHYAGAHTTAGVPVYNTRCRVAVRTCRPDRHHMNVVARIRNGLAVAWRRALEYFGQADASCKKQCTTPGS